VKGPTAIRIRGGGRETERGGESAKRRERDRRRRASGLCSADVRGRGAERREREEAAGEAAP